MVVAVVAFGLLRVECLAIVFALVGLSSHRGRRFDLVYPCYLYL